MQRSDATAQNDIKTADRNAGFERLYELLDWLALEFFDDDRLLFLGADTEKGREAESLNYNADRLSVEMPQMLDLTGKVVREKWTYYPRVDVTITAGDSVVKGKQATLQALQALTASQITPETGSSSRRSWRSSTYRTSRISSGSGRRSFHSRRYRPRPGRRERSCPG